LEIALIVKYSVDCIVSRHMLAFFINIIFLEINYIFNYQIGVLIWKRRDSALSSR